MADVSAGDLVQIRPGAIDVTNGVVAKAGWKYVDGHALWMTVEKVVPNWRTGGRSGLPTTVTKVRCTYGGVVVWQVQPEDIIPQVVKASEPEIVTVEPEPTPTTSTPKPTETPYVPTDRWGSGSTQVGGSSLAFYAIAKGQENWKGANSPAIRPQQPEGQAGAVLIETQDKGSSFVDAFAGGLEVTEETGGVGWRDLTPDERKVIGPKMLINDTSIQERQFATSVHPVNRTRRKLMLNDIEKEIQNVHGFPDKLKAASDPFEDSTLEEMVSAQYDYRINVADTRYKLTGPTLEEQLEKVRASFGLTVHGSNMIARAMKYYLYNRFKSPDINLAHTKHVTHVFFTRPDLNILKRLDNNTLVANSQVMNHTDTALIWRRYPELFKLLSDSDMSGDPDNFNLLLSSQVKSFEILDETLSTNDAGHSWNEHAMTYGDAYTGRTAGEFTCTFDETSDFSIINMMKLWITYIDAVSHGAWSPSYNLTARGDGVSSSLTIDDSHVFKKALDYASSAYVIKCDPTGENILYWTKYYGVFPTNTGASALSWDADNGVGGTPKLSIKFAYSCKKDLSPISLLEFNRAAKVPMGASQLFDPTFDITQNQSGRPIVGTPFIAIKLASPTIQGPGVNYQGELTKIRLLFKPAIQTDSRLTDDLIYRNDMSTRDVRYLQRKKEIEKSITNSVADTPELRAKAMRQYTGKRLSV